MMPDTTIDPDLLARCDSAAYRIHRTRVGTFTVLRYDPIEADEVVVIGTETEDAAKAYIMRELMRARGWFATRVGRRWTPEDGMPAR